MGVMEPRFSPCRTSTAAILAAVVLWALPAAAQPAGCPELGPAQVVLEPLDAPLTHDTARSAAQLTAMPGRAPSPLGRQAGRALGLTAAEFTARSRFQLVFQGEPGGAVCGSLKNLIIAFGYARRTVYIARELPPASCIHGEVLAHEMEHVAIDDRVLAEFRPRFQQQMQALVEQLPPVRGRSTDQVARTLQRSVEAVINRSLEEFGRERDRRQARLDTVEEYRRVSESCNGELSQYLPVPAVKRR